jgi:hypothetical protein
VGLDQFAGALNSPEASSAVRITSTAVCVYLAVGAAGPLLARGAHRDAALVLGAVFLLQLLAEALVGPGLLRAADAALVVTALFAVVSWASSFGHARLLRKRD